MRSFETNRRRMIGGLVLPFICLLGVACRPLPIVVNLAYTPPEVAAIGETEGSRGLIVHMSPVADERSNQKTLGSTTVPVLPGSDVLTWVQDGLLTLRDAGFELVLSGSDPPDGYRVLVTVNRVYVRSVRASLRGSVVLSVEYFQGGLLLGKRLHRGDGVVEDASLLEGTYRFNEGRVLQVLNEALGQAVGQVAATIVELEGK